jgi:glycosyltransferase involved in cell wall biosynthesis
VYADADLFLAPAVLESFGLAALEARCTGLPVVARSQAGIGGFVRHGVEGLLVDDDGQMARATAALLADPVRLDRMQRHNRTVRTTLGWDSVAERCLTTYAVAIGAPARIPARLPVPRQVAPVGS